MKLLRLRPTALITNENVIHLDPDNNPVPVMRPEIQTPEQRAETIDRLRRIMGADMPGF